MTVVVREPRLVVQEKERHRLAVSVWLGVSKGVSGGVCGESM